MAEYASEAPAAVGGPVITSADRAHGAPRIHAVVRGGGPGAAGMDKADENAACNIRDIAAERAVTAREGPRDTGPYTANLNLSWLLSRGGWAAISARHGGEDVKFPILFADAEAQRCRSFLLR